GLLGDVGGPAAVVMAAGQYAGFDGGGGAVGHPVRAGGAIVQPLPSFFVVAADPAMRALAGDAQFFGHVGDGPALDADAPYQQDPPVKGQAGVSVGHEDLRFGVDGISTSSGGLPIDQAPAAACHQPDGR